MSDSKKKLAHIRTFAGDMKQRQAHDTSTETKKPTTGTTPDVTTSPSTEKAQPHSADNTTETKKGADAKEDTLDKNPANPPFHKLQQKNTPKKTTPQTLQDSAASITDHPESILDDKKKKHFSVSGDGSSSATIVSDTKHARKSVLRETLTSLQNWVKQIKNTYITPPKPSYTVNRAERRAGVLQSATPKTGVSHVEHDTVADRIRNRYTKQENDSHVSLSIISDHTDPVFLPSLPPGKGTVATATDVVVKPRRDGTQTTQSDRQDKTPEETNPEPIFEVSEKESEQTNKSAAPSTTVHTPAAKTETVTQSQIPPKDAKVENVQALPKEDSSLDQPTEKPQNVQANTATDRAKKSNVLNAAESASTDTKQPAPTSTTEPLPDRTASIPSDFRKEYEIAVARADTNRLSLRIVGVGVGCVLLAIVTYNAVPMLLSDDTPTTTVSIIVGSDTHILMIDQYGSSAARFAALRTILDTHSSTITHIIPHRTNQSQQSVPATGQEVADALSLNLPPSIVANLNTIHFGDHQNYDRFIYMDIQNERESFGAMLDWEDTLLNDLAVWFEVRSSGVFRDETILDHDARVFRDNDGVAQLIYTIVDGHIIITTRPTVLESLVLSHQ